MFTNEIRPYNGNADHRDKPCDAFRVAHMGVLDIEAGRLHCFKSRLDLPTFLISQNRILGTIEANKYLQFRNTIGVFNPAASQINELPLMKKNLVIEFLLSYLETVEQPPRTNSLSCGRLYNPEVLPDTDIIPDWSEPHPGDD